MIKITICLTVLSVITLTCSSTFNSFTTKQCAISNNCTSNDNSILIAIDGTGSRIYFEESGRSKKYKSSIGINNNKNWIWQSHVANFWEQYEGISHYFYGPDANEMVLAGNEVQSIVDKAHSKICQFINDHHKEIQTSQQIYDMTINGELGIDIIGYSRGGFAAMELSRALQFIGCKNDDYNIKPIPVRWMGLYDPVQRDIDFGDIFEIGDGYDNEEIAENVINVSIVERSRFIHSRSYFGYGVNGNNENKKEINASHSGIGGQPGKGDCKEKHGLFDVAADLCSSEYTYKLDKNGALETEEWMRHNAVLSNVPIAKYDDYNKYFQGFVDLNE